MALSTAAPSSKLEDSEIDLVQWAQITELRDDPRTAFRTSIEPYHAQMSFISCKNRTCYQRLRLFSHAPVVTPHSINVCDRA
ncbi:hypothetical protein FRC0477_01200 [Corynebacterium diphtheriae]|nr:hypothetical protein FRC0477_01200 [Corynebacterium diphtheriae]